MIISSHKQFSPSYFWFGAPDVVFCVSNQMVEARTDDFLASQITMLHSE
jgi:hypothetical protein